jgi:hypothetical protein
MLLLNIIHERDKQGFSSNDKQSQLNKRYFKVVLRSSVVWDDPLVPESKYVISYQNYSLQ